MRPSAWFSSLPQPLRQSTQPGYRASFRAYFGLLLSLLILGPVCAQSLSEEVAPTPVPISDKDQTQASHHLPDLGAPVDHTTLQPNIDAQGAGLTYHDTIDNKQFSLVPQYTKLNGMVVNSSVAVPLSQDTAMGFLLTAGSTKNEWLINTGLNMSEHQRVIFTLGQLRQKLDFAFTSGTQKAQMTQDNGALSYQYFLGRDWINATELNAYTSNTSSISLGDKTYYTDTSTLYELWNDPRRIAGARVSGVQSKLVLTPTTSTNLKLGFGGERLTYDYLSGKSTTTRATGSTELNQRLNDDVSLRATAITAAAQNRYSAGVANHFAGGSLGLDVITIRGRDGTFNDNQLLLNYTHNFGSTPSSVAAPALGMRHSSATDPAVASEQPANTQASGSKPTWASPLLDQVALRPSFLPAQVVAKVDATVTQTRLIAIDKNTVAGTINNATGVITAPTGTAVSSTFAGITKNAVVFVNAGQFAISSDNLNLIVNPNLITQPAVGVTDTYVVTMNNLSGGGTTLATIIITHGSRHIKSILMNSGQIAPTLSSFALSSGSVVFGASPPTISAVSSNSIGAITYTSSNAAVASIDSSRVITLVGAGTVTFTATQAANGNYASGTISTASLTVTTASQGTLTASASPTSIVAITGTSTLSTSGGSGAGAVTYGSTGGCTIVGTTLTAGATVGTCSVTATKAADLNYTVSTGTVNVTVTAIGTVATPTFSPAAGGIAFGTTVTIISAGADAIYYTTDGSTPTTASTNQATTPLVINAAVPTLKALAVKAGYTNSAIATVAYTQAVATAPNAITLAVGSSTPVGGITNVAIPAVSGTDTTGAVTGWVTSTANKIKFTVTAGSSGTSSITINGSAYTSAADYTITAASALTIVVTTTETGKATGVRTFSVSVAEPLPAGYIVSGGLTWSRPVFGLTSTQSFAACATLGAGWSMPDTPQTQDLARKIPRPTGFDYSMWIHTSTQTVSGEYDLVYLDSSLVASGYQNNTGFWSTCVHH